ncbi:hypothetical protein [Streptococcus halotolerans]|uniref:hypothetical protein n=1 Tax=Streptococcus halotolerans TaxID=1814128 RepID=UPI0007899E36|nr:hypothetical protein [Streptococcus halotolerans]QBX08365.1 hypothetical protein JavanS251_0007 [Streptococcus satellite phage Javan251]
MTTDFYGLMLEEINEANGKLSLLVDWICLKAKKTNDSTMNGALDLAKSAMISQAEAYQRLSQAKEQHYRLTRDLETTADETMSEFIAWLDGEMLKGHEVFKDSQILSKHYQAKSVKEYILLKAEEHAIFPLKDANVTSYIETLIINDMKKYNANKPSLFSKVGVKI